MITPYSRFTVIACWKDVDKKNNPEFIGALWAVKLNKCPTRGDLIIPNETQLKCKKVLIYQKNIVCITVYKVKLYLCD